MKSAIRILALLGCLALAACDGTALVTLTATPATILSSTPPGASGAVNGFLTYRVNLVSVALQQSSGSSSQNVLPSPVSIDLSQATNFSEIIGESSVRKGTYTGVVVTLDYTNATIVADNGTLGGVPLTPKMASGQSAGQISLNLEFDPASPLVITRGNTSQLSLGFMLSASNIVNLAGATVTVTPVMSASSLAIDTKMGRLRGLLSGATVDASSSTGTSSTTGTSVTSTTTGTYTTGIKPFDGLVSAAGSMSVAPTPTTVFEINGNPSIGTAGITALAALSAGTWTVTYGTLASSTSTTEIPLSTDTTDASDAATGIFGSTSTDTTDTTTTPIETAFTTSTNVSFTPTEIWAGSSVQGGGLDRISGVVTARSGNTLTVPSATWTTSAGVTSFLHGSATIMLGSGTAVILPAQAGVQSNPISNVSVGSVIDAFGTATEGTSGDVSLDATAGRVRLEDTVASGVITDSASLNLLTLGGRGVGAFQFAGTGSASGNDSIALNYQVSIGALDLTDSNAGAPVEATGLVNLYGAAPPDFIATQLLDVTSINAELVIDWGSAGIAEPFDSITTSELGLLSTDTVPGLRHQIAVGAQTVDVSILGADVLIEPSTTTTVVYSIVHAASATIENFNTFAAFATQLQSELNGSTAVLTMTADGIYTAAGNILLATSVTVELSV